MDTDSQCGNDLRFLEWWLTHHGKHPKYSEVISDLAQVTQALVQVVVASTEISNRELAREFRGEAAILLRGAADRMASANPGAVGA